MTPTANPILTVIITVFLGMTGPVAAWLLSKGVPANEIGPFMQALQVCLVTVTPALAATFLGWLNTVKNRVAGVKSMPPEAVNAAVANMPPEARTAIKVAAMPDSALISAVTAMPDVTQLVVKDTAKDGAAKAAADPAQPKVMTVSDAKTA
jgi:hypothetical protein